MMGWYYIKLLILLPLFALLIWGTLRLGKRVQAQVGRGTDGEQRIELLETRFLGPGLRLAVIEFRGREILVGCSKQGLVHLGEAAGMDHACLPTKELD